MTIRLGKSLSHPIGKSAKAISVRGNASNMDTETKNSRQNAADDFMESLAQLENLLADGAMAKRSKGTPSAGDRLDSPHRFGGSLLDAIPLAQRLSIRLSQPNAADDEPHREVAP